MTIAVVNEATLIPELWLLDRHHTQLSVAAAGAIEARRLGRNAPAERSWRGIIGIAKRMATQTRRKRKSEERMVTQRIQIAVLANGNDLGEP